MMSKWIVRNTRQAQRHTLFFKKIFENARRESVLESNNMRDRCVRTVYRRKCSSNLRFLRNQVVWKTGCLRMKHRFMIKLCFDDSRFYVTSGLVLEVQPKFRKIRRCRPIFSQCISISTAAYLRKSAPPDTS